MPGRLCPPWIAYWLANPLRRLLQKPEEILSGLLAPGLTALDIGPGMGFFSLPMARLVQPDGIVICVDVQEKMLQGLRRRAEAAGLADRIVTRVCPPDSLSLEDYAGQVDFALVFAVVHEMPDVPQLFADLAAALKPGAKCLLAEPRGHVSPPAFARTLSLAEQAGLAVTTRPAIRGSHAALLTKAAP